MDAPSEQDIELQRNAASYIEELKEKLPRFFFKTRSDAQRCVRHRVRATTTSRLCNLLEPFQEWPQLLDQHLPALIKPLQDALLELCKARSSKLNAHHGELVQSSEFAACKLLYTLCKIRGAKVISRFLDNSTENLELLLEFLEGKLEQSPKGSQGGSYYQASWEEKYVFLLWMAHLLFAPFDLNTVGSSKPPVASGHTSIQLPSGLPPIAARLIYLALAHVGAPSKEREGAVKLLSRLSARRDMMTLGVHDRLFEYALSMLEAAQSHSHSIGSYDFIGCLSLLSGLLSTLQVTALKPYILVIFKNMLLFTTYTGSEIEALTSTAVSRKLVVKNLRNLSVLALQLASDSERSDSTYVEFILEDTIDYLLNALADKDTPVRQAASKAISAIVMRLDADLAGEVVESVIGSLDENVLWVNEARSQIPRAESTLLNPQNRERKRDLSAVDPLRWHGLVLTLAQLLFQRSAPASQLSAIINSLALALGFEQRVTSGSAIGGNVRDAANFGIWSIARKYSTKELAHVRADSVRALTIVNQPSSITVLQALAAELTIAATLDPSGNIRRGSSAALQELIGRHPDTIYEGIAAVQVVDYQAVSLRSRAFSVVAIEASGLNEYYWRSLLSAMTGWRGLEAADAPARRLAATSIRSLAQVMSIAGTVQSAEMIYNKLSQMKVHSVEKRHGLLLAAAALISDLPMDASTIPLAINFWSLLKPRTILSREDLVSQTSRPELTAEAVSAFIAALAGNMPPDHGKIVDTDALHTCMDYLSLAMDRRELSVMSAAADAARNICSMLEPDIKRTYVTRWIAKVDARLEAHDTGPHQGYLIGLASLYGQLDASRENTMRSEILATLFRALKSGPIDDVHTRVAALNALQRGIFWASRQISSDVVSSLQQCLRDYTTDERGDIGSLVRMEAIEVTNALLKSCQFRSNQDKETLLAQVAVLSGEKLDKMRFHAWNCLLENMSSIEVDESLPEHLTTINEASTQAFFSDLLSLLRIQWLFKPIIQGICVSAGAGSESVLRAARAALLHHHLCSSNAEVLKICTVMLDVLRENLSDDRMCVPVLETWVYMLQSNLFAGEIIQGFAWRRLFVLVQKAHFKSGSIPKLTAAVQIYSLLAERTDLRIDVMKKLSSMLLHPHARVRNAAAEALFMCSHNGNILDIDWSKAPKDLKSAVENIKGNVVVVNGETKRS